MWLWYVDVEILGKKKIERKQKIEHYSKVYNDACSARRLFLITSKLYLNDYLKCMCNNILGVCSILQVEWEREIQYNAKVKPFILLRIQISQINYDIKHAFFIIIFFFCLFVRFHVYLYNIFITMTLENDTKNKTYQQLWIS